jgi:hypothetical protein
MLYLREHHLVEQEMLHLQACTEKTYRGEEYVMLNERGKILCVKNADNRE